MLLAIDVGNTQTVLGLYDGDRLTEHWRIATAQGAVHVWVPEGYDRESAGTVIYVHGYYTDADGAWRDHLLVAITVEELNGSAASALVREGHASWA